MHLIRSVLSLGFWLSLVITCVEGDFGRFWETVGDYNLGFEIQSVSACLRSRAPCIGVKFTELESVKGVPGTPSRDPRVLSYE